MQSDQRLRLSIYSLVYTFYKIIIIHLTTIINVKVIQKVAVFCYFDCVIFQRNVRPIDMTLKYGYNSVG